VPDWLYTEDERKAMGDLLIAYQTQFPLLTTAKEQKALFEKYCLDFAAIIGEDRAAAHWKLWSVWT